MDADLFFDIERVEGAWRESDKDMPILAPLLDSLHNVDGCLFHESGAKVIVRGVMRNHNIVDKDDSGG